MRKLAIMICAWVATVATYAQTLTLGYCNGEVSTETNWGGQGTGNTSAAIYVPASMLGNLTGGEIQTIRAGMSTRLNIDELYVWVRSSLTGENLAEGKLNRKQTRVQQGWNEVDLNEPFVITGEGIYIGYTYHHKSLARAVSIVGTTPAETAFYQEYEDAAWQDMSSEGAISIEAIVSGSALPQYDLSLTKVSITPDLANGLTAYAVKADVANVATNSVKGFSITLSGGGIDDVTKHVSQTVESGKQATVSFSFVASSAINASEPITATISAIDNADDENQENNTVAASFAAFQRNVLLEEFTTERCPNCPSGAERMNAALHSNADYADRVSVVCHHSAFGTDDFTQTCDEDFVWFFNEGGQAYAPAWMINRQGRYDQNVASTGEKQAIYWFTESNELISELDQELALPTHVMLGAKAYAEDGKVHVNILGVRDANFNLPNALLTVYVTEDNITGKQQSHDGVINPYQHQHVIRAYNSTWGDAINWEGDTFTANYTFDLDNDWKLKDMKVVALVANYDADNNLNCAVENSTAALVETEVPDMPTSISMTSTPNTLHPTAIYDLQGRMVYRGYEGTKVRGYENQRSAPTGKANSDEGNLAPSHPRTPAPSMKKGIYIMNGKKVVNQ